MTFVTVAARRWTQKPPPGTDLDRTHPWCPDHCWPFLTPQGTAQSLARHARLKTPTTTGDMYAVSSVMVPGGKYGLSVRHVGTDSFLRLTADDTTEVEKAIPSSGGMTLLFAYRKTDATARISAAFGVQSGNSSPFTGRFSVLLPYPAGPDGIYFYFGGNTEGTNQLSVGVAAAGIVFGDDLWAFTTGPRGMEIWQNGKRVASNSANPSRASAAGERLACPAYATGGDLADIGLVMTWRRQLTVAEIRAVSLNPWQVFQPRTTMAVASALATKVPALLLAP